MIFTEESVISKLKLLTDPLAAEAAFRSGAKGRRMALEARVVPVYTWGAGRRRLEQRRKYSPSNWHKIKALRM